jgi:hypothetical protein
VIPVPERNLAAAVVRQAFVDLRFCREWQEDARQFLREGSTDLMFWCDVLGGIDPAVIVREARRRIGPLDREEAAA